MNRNKLKTYAPEARREFIQAMNDRAAFFGLTAKAVEPIVVRGDVAVIAGRDYPRAVADKRQKLEARIARDGFEQTMEAMAYTWFNRFVAIRFMELHGYLDHGYRVLSHPDGKPTPEILEHAEHVELPGLKKDRVIDLKLDGNKESDLYRLLLTAQCNALHKAMPFLFERIDDETELLLPANLLHSDSLVRKLVDGIDEDDWKEVEIIGWLYQFYISERHDQVIGKAIANADIPAATQLFTPNWIVKYLVQNTLGRQWLATYPSSSLRSQMEFYVELPQQQDDVASQLRTITPTSLAPEELTMLDPACGSCHVLVEGYDLFKAIYLERGYRLKDIPSLILTKNLYGLEIDDRAAQLGAFALLMKARADDRRIFEHGVEPNIVSFQDSKGLSAGALCDALNEPTAAQRAPRNYLFREIDEAEAPLLMVTDRPVCDPIRKEDIKSLLDLFADAKTRGSMIQVPLGVLSKLSAIEQRVDHVLAHGDLAQKVVGALKPLITQARILGRSYRVVAGNPPYIGGRYLTGDLKEFIQIDFDEHTSDLFAAFTARSIKLVEEYGALAFMTPFVWMFLSSYEPLRRLLTQESSILSLVRPEYHAFFESAYVPICAFAFQRNLRNAVGTYIDLTSFYGEELQPRKTLEAIADNACPWKFNASSADFSAIPGAPIAYWVGDAGRRAFRENGRLGDLASPRAGISTGDNELFQREWYEVPLDHIGFGVASADETFDELKRWYPCNSGGAFRKWYGNNETVVDWQNDGHSIRNFFGKNGKLRSAPRSRQYYFRPGVTWTKLSSSNFGARLREPGFIFDDTGRSAFPLNEDYIPALLGLLCSNSVPYFLSILSPTLSFTSGDVANIPANEGLLLGYDATIANRAVEISRQDWDALEESWNFERSPLVGKDSQSLQASVELWMSECARRRQALRDVERENNAYFINAYGLQTELASEPRDEDLTLYAPTETGEVRRLISYVIGCILGRYNLGEPGLAYAHSSRTPFDATRYNAFPSSVDGIVPLLDLEWGIDGDATDRIVEFLSRAWTIETLDENLRFLAKHIGQNNGENPLQTIRRYMANGFYKAHLSMYKKRPIYWLFSSGKYRAFQCLVYLHRYNEGMLGRMRTEYVLPLQGKIIARIEQIEGEKLTATSTSHRKKLQKEQDDLKKRRVELIGFEEKLKHFADQRIKLDLDDGVKANYAKFGDLLAEVKAVTGGKDAE